MLKKKTMHCQLPTSECKKCSSSEAEEEDLGHVVLLEEEVGVPSEIFLRSDSSPSCPALYGEGQVCNGLNLRLR